MLKGKQVYTLSKIDKQKRNTYYIYSNSSLNEDIVVRKNHKNGLYSAYIHYYTWNIEISRFNSGWIVEDVEENIMLKELENNHNAKLIKRNKYLLVGYLLKYRLGFKEFVGYEFDYNFIEFYFINKEGFQRCWRTRVRWVKEFKEDDVLSLFPQ